MTVLEMISLKGARVFVASAGFTYVGLISYQAIARIEFGLNRLRGLSPLLCACSICYSSRDRRTGRRRPYA